VKGYPAHDKHAALNTLGAAVYRAGRFEHAILRLQEGIKARKVAEQLLNWIFFAMANHRLGHPAEVRDRLDLLRERQPSSDNEQSSEELAIRLLLSEAESVILYDPVFPSDPSPSELPTASLSIGIYTDDSRATGDAEPLQVSLIKSLLQFFCTGCQYQPSATTMRSKEWGIINL
jgi:hypothetical protein